MRTTGPSRYRVHVVADKCDVRNAAHQIPSDKPKSLLFYDFSTKKTRQVFSIEKNFASGLSISPDGRYLLFSQIDEENSNIMLVDHLN